MKRYALLAVDIQNDFCPGGALPVPEGDRIIPRVNDYLEIFRLAGGLVVASRDWHPVSSSHFKPRGGPWPVHCVRNTPGAEFHRQLRLPPETIVISKGQSENDDGYSAFDGFAPDGKTLADVLREKEVRAVFVCGLATDYCVKASCLSALAVPMRVYVLADAVRGVDVSPGDSARALEEIAAGGGRMINMEECRNLLGGKS